MNYSYNCYYNWITDKIAIGELNSSYEPFDMIVNLAYINPSYNKGLEHRQYRIVLDDKLKYEFGLFFIKQSIVSPITLEESEPRCSPLPFTWLSLRP